MWQHQQDDLSFLCGQSHVWIAFGVSEMAGMYSGYSEGAYVDNVSLTATIPDPTPPTTVASGYDSAWHNSAVPVTLTATDNAGGSGVKSITYAVDGGAPTTVDAATTQVTIAAPADHTNDGTHTIAFHATDNAGNTETPDKTCTVKIDTSAPKATVKALTVSAAKAARGKTLTFKVIITDPKPGCGRPVDPEGDHQNGQAGASPDDQRPAHEYAAHGRLCHLQDDGQGELQDRRHCQGPGRQQAGQGGHSQAHGHVGDNARGRGGRQRGRKLPQRRPDSVLAIRVPFWKVKVMLLPSLLRSTMRVTWPGSLLMPLPSWPPLPTMSPTWT